MYEYKVKSVDRVVDGDTVDVTLDLGFGLFKKERVRVAGIDTPEKRTRNADEKKLGYDATHYAELWFGTEYNLTVRTEKDGKYGRMLGWFYRGEECFNHKIVEDGYAFVYDGGTKFDMNNPETLQILLTRRGYSNWEEYTEANP